MAFCCSSADSTRRGIVESSGNRVELGGEHAARARAAPKAAAAQPVQRDRVLRKINVREQTQPIVVTRPSSVGEEYAIRAAPTVMTLVLGHTPYYVRCAIQVSFLKGRYG